MSSPLTANTTGSGARSVRPVVDPSCGGGFTVPVFTWVEVTRLSYVLLDEISPSPSTLAWICNLAVRSLLYFSFASVLSSRPLLSSVVRCLFLLSLY